MFDESYASLPGRFHSCLQRLGFHWAMNPTTDRWVDSLQAEVLKALGQVEFCLSRVQAIEREEGRDGSEYSTAGAIAYEVEVLTEAFYYSCHRLIQLSKVKSLGLSALQSRLHYCDVTKVRNHLIEHPNKFRGVPGHAFGWCLPHGPEIKPWATEVGMKAAGCYSHALEVVDVLTDVLDAMGIRARAVTVAEPIDGCVQEGLPRRTVALEFEESFANEHPTDVRDDLERAARLRSVVQARLERPISFPAGPGALNGHAAMTFLQLLAKGYKTFRSTELLATAGWESEAASLTRSLLEAAFQARFLLGDGKDVAGIEKRVGMLWAHRMHNMGAAAEKMLGARELRESQAGEGLRALAGQLKDARANSDADATVRHHWSGNRDQLRGVATDLGLYHWYAAAYPHLSEAAHALDVAGHVEPMADGTTSISFDPSRRGVRVTMAWACLFFADLTESVFRALGEAMDLDEFKIRVGGSPTPEVDRP